MTDHSGSSSSYARKKQTERQRNQRRSFAGTNIGEPPKIVDPDRRERGRQSGAEFLRAYFPDTFYLPFSESQLRIINLADHVIEYGGMQAAAMPRGSGKTSMFERLTLRALLYGFRKFAVILGANAEAAEDILETIKTELFINDLLLEDFPEVCHPIRALEQIANRVKGQHIDGKKTNMVWHKHKLQLPTVDGSKSSGAVIVAKGILARLRGLKVKSHTGQEMRPDLVVPDDPQTDNSAHSQFQIAKRLKVLRGTVLGLAGPGVKITAFCPCTVICPGDMADQLLDRERCPEWHGIRVPLMESMPSNKDLWEQYYEIRAREFDADLPNTESTEFYRSNQPAMDLGAVPTWDARFNPDEISAVQHAMNLIQERGQEAFDAEFQNDPKANQSTNIAQWLLKPAEIETRVWRPEGTLLLPEWAKVITGFIDVQQRLLYWMICCWGDGFRGHVLRYGTWPEQPSASFSYATARNTIQLRYHGGLAAQLDGAGSDLIKWLQDIRFDDRPIDRIGMDTGWKSSSVIALATENPIVLPAKGQGLLARNRPFSEYTKKENEVLGHHWRETPGKAGTRLFHIDTNEWKTRVHQAIATTPGERESLTLPITADANAQLISHLLSETVTEDRTDTRMVYVWTLPTTKPDNHWFDCLVGNMALASRLGIIATQAEVIKKRRAKRISAEELAEHNRRAAAARYRR